MNAIINLLGLTIGFTAFILICLFLNYEYSYDKYNKNYDRIYRIQVHATLDNQVKSWTQSPSSIADLIKDKYPEIEKNALVREAWGEYLSTSAIQSFYEPDGFYADPAFLEIFTFDFIQGNSKNALSEPFSIILSKTIANKLFPNVNAIGKTMQVEKKYNLKVTGVYNDLSHASHIRPTYVISMPSISTVKNWNNYRNEWSINFRNYVLLKKGADVKRVNDKIVNVISDNHKDVVSQKLYLNPLSNLYLHPADKNDYMVAIAIYGIVAIFILFLSAINYINLTTSNASIRVKEIAVRKVNGSSRGSLVKQFLGETIIMSLLSLLMAFMLSKLLLPLFNSVVSRDIDFSVSTNWHFILIMIGVSLITGFISGIYPAIVLSSLKMLDLLKGTVFRKLKGELGPKKILVTFQFAISIFLIINSIVIFQQVKFMMNKELGFNKDNLLYADFRNGKEIDFEDLRNKVLKHPEIIDGALSESLPFNGSNGWSMNWEGNNSDERVDVRYNAVTFDYINTLGMSIIMGRDFSRNYTSDVKNACLINETAVKRFGWDDPIGKTVDGQYKVVGVVKDFHPYSPHEPIPPFLIRLKTGPIKDRYAYTFRVQPGKINEARMILNDEFESYFPNDPFEFHVFSEELKRDYTFLIWKSINKTIMFFTVIIILLAIIGIVGLVSFTTKQKTKEIGIRKVHGSPVIRIYSELLSEFIVLLTIAVLIACPCAYYLYSFIPGAYKYGIHLWEFLLAISMVVLITLITTSYQTIKVALTNPVEALRYE